jgi:Cys-tRNA synthase (O-phospho-L-seryl-tRNA:Cys-tRNA synthase)
MEGLTKKLKLAIIGMLKAKIVIVTNLAREIKEKMPTTRRSK